jgi:HTH-type transcriptional regulator/antitoxin HigA
MQPLLPLWNDPEEGTERGLPPGYYIQRELTKRGWGQADLAFVLQRPLPTVNEIIKGKKAVTPEMAVALGNAFGTSPDLWAHREAAYRLSLVKNAPDDDTARKAKLFESIPIKDMQRRGWINAESTTAEELEKEVEKFLKAEILAVARQSQASSEFSNAQRAWLASKVKVRPFSRDKLIAALPKLRQLAASPENAAHAPIMFAELGIRLVVVEALPRTKIDGAAFFLNGDPQQPVIVLSLRINRMESVWHTIGHEIQHILRGDPFSLDVALVGEDRASLYEEMERAANEGSANWLIPKDEMDSFVIRTMPNHPRERIIQFANRMGIHPAIVVGQLHFRENKWEKNNDLCPPVRDHFLATTTKDGYSNN